MAGNEGIMHSKLQPAIDSVENHSTGLAEWPVSESRVALGSDPDNLTQFLELVARNQKANAAKFPAPTLLMRRVNICLYTAGKNLINPKPVMACVLFCHPMPLT